MLRNLGFIFHKMPLISLFLLFWSNNTFCITHVEESFWKKLWTCRLTDYGWWWWCVTIQVPTPSKFYLFTNWCTSELSWKTILKFTLKQLRHVSVLQLHHHQSTAEQSNIQTPIRTQYMQPHHHRINHTLFQCYSYTIISLLPNSATYRHQ